MNRQTRIKQQGAALVTALLLMLVLTVLGLASMGTGVMQMRIGVNEEQRVEAFHLAQAVADEIASSQTNFPWPATSGTVINCTAGCSNTSLVLPTSLPIAENSASVRFMTPATGTPPFRHRRVASSVAGATANYFQIEAQHGTRGDGGGWARVTQGYVLLTPSH